MSIIEKGNEWARKNPFKFIIVAIFVIGLSIKIGSTIGSTFSGTSACDCANLYQGSPMSKGYTPEQLDDRDFLQKEANNYIEKAKKCALQYGNLDDMEKELARTATEMTWIPKLDEAIENAKKECGK